MWSQIGGTHSAKVTLPSITLSAYKKMPKQAMSWQQSSTEVNANRPYFMFWQVFAYANNNQDVQTVIKQTTFSVWEPINTFQQNKLSCKNYLSPLCPIVSPVENSATAGNWEEKQEIKKMRERSYVISTALMVSKGHVSGAHILTLPMTKKLSFLKTTAMQL